MGRDHAVHGPQLEAFRVSWPLPDWQGVSRMEQNNNNLNENNKSAKTMLSRLTTAGQQQQSKLMNWINIYWNLWNLWNLFMRQSKGPSKVILVGIVWSSGWGLFWKELLLVTDHLLCLSYVITVTCHNLCERGEGFAEQRVVVFIGQTCCILLFQFFFVNKLFTAHNIPEINNGVDQTTVTRVLPASLTTGTIL